MSNSSSRPATRSTSGTLPSSSRNVRATTSSASTSRIGTSSSSGGLKRDRDTFSAELERDTNLPTKRHLRTNLNNTLTAASLERQLATLQTTRVSLETKLREKESQIGLLEQDRRWFAEREKVEREEREKTVAESSERETNLHNELSALKAAYSALQGAHIDLQETHSALQHTSTHQIEVLKSQLNALEKQNAYLEGQVEEERTRADRASVADLPGGIPTSSSLTSLGSESDADHRLLTSELHRQADYLRELESKNTRLQADLIVMREQNSVLSERNAEVEVVREEKRGLEKKLKVKEALVEKLIREGEKIKSEQQELLQHHASPLRRSVSRMSLGSGSGALFTPRKKPGASGVLNGHQTPDTQSHLPLNPSTLSTHLGLDDESGSNMEEDDELMSVDELPTIATTSELNSLRLKHATLLESHGQVAADLAEMTARCSALQQELKELKEDEDEKLGEAGKRKAERDAEITDLHIRVRVKDQELEAAQRELSFLSQFVDKLSSDISPTSSHPAADPERLSQLEILLAEAKRSNHELRREVDSLLERLKRERVLAEQRTREVEEVKKEMDLKRKESKRKEAQDAEATRALETKVVEHEKKKREAVENELQEAQTTIATHLTTIDNLEQQLFDLGGEIAGGRHVPPGVHILSMKENPVQEWFDLRQVVFDRLRGENEALLKRLSEVEAKVGNVPELTASTSSAKELVPRESWELVVKEKEESDDMVKQYEKRLLRLKQVFAAKTTEFREAIAVILGVKLAFYPNGQVRVTSVFDLSASFVFQPVSKTSSSEGMKMQLVAQGEGGPQDLPNMMQYWINTEQCIPGFLASVTLECYENSKRSMDT